MENKTTIDNINGHLQDITKYKLAVQSATFAGSQAYTISKLLSYLDNIESQLKNKRDEALANFTKAHNE